jgi:hypothetical protein
LFSFTAFLQLVASKPIDKVNRPALRVTRLICIFYIFKVDCKKYEEIVATGDCGVRQNLYNKKVCTLSSTNIKFLEYLLLNSCSQLLSGDFLVKSIGVASSPGVSKANNTRFNQLTAIFMV